MRKSSPTYELLKTNKILVPVRSQLMCFSSPKIPDPPPPPQVPPEDEPGEVEIGREALATKGKKRRVRGRRVLTVGLSTPKTSQYG